MIVGTGVGSELRQLHQRRRRLHPVLRNKIDQGFEPKLIHTVRGVGYVLSEEGVP